MEIRINLAVRGTQCAAELEQDMPITTGSRGVFRAVLHADSSWDGMDKTVVFRAGQISRSQHIGIDGTSCLVPPEVLAERAPYLEIGVYGTAGEDVVRTTTWARLYGIVPGAVPTGDAMESPDLYAQLLAQLRATVKTVNGQAPDENGNVTVEGGGGGAGTPGGYYTPTVTQPDGNTMRVSYTPSDRSMPAVESSDVTLPSGAGGKTAYEYAQGGGYTGTEEEFSTRLAQEIPAVDSTLTQSGQAADAAAVGDRLSALSEEISDCIKAPPSAEVGQTIVVKAVDEDGKPTEWEASDFPDGNAMAIIQSYTISDSDVMQIDFTGLNLSEFELVIDSPKVTGTALYSSADIYINGLSNNYKTITIPNYATYSTINRKIIVKATKNGGREALIVAQAISAGDEFNKTDLYKSINFTSHEQITEIHLVLTGTDRYFNAGSVVTLRGRKAV